MNTMNSPGLKRGRPPKKIKRDQRITVSCTKAERDTILNKAGQAGVNASQYLLTIGVNNTIDTSRSDMAKNMLLYKGLLNHTVENLNHYMRKLNTAGTLTVEEKMEYRNLSALIKEVVLYMKCMLI